VKSIPGTVFHHDTMKGDALSLSLLKNIVVIISVNPRTGNVGGYGSKKGSYNNCR